MAGLPLRLIPFLSGLLVAFFIACTTYESEADFENESQSVYDDRALVSEANGSTIAVDVKKMTSHINELASESYDGRVPGTDGGTKAVEYLRKKFGELNLLKKFKDSLDNDSYLQNFDYQTSQVPNVIGVLEGTDDSLKDEIILVGAHFDHLGRTDDCKGNSSREEKLLCAGADDNASGVAVLLEMVRLIVENKLKPKRTLVFAAFNAEETGLYGSKAYVSNPLYPLAKIKAMLNLDMVGAGDGSGCTVLGALKDDNVTPDPDRYWIKTLMEKSAKAMDLKYEVLVWKPEVNSDCYPFDKASVPCVFIWSNPDDAHSKYHSADDNIANIKPKALLASAKLVWAALKPLANGEEKSYTE